MLDPLARRVLQRPLDTLAARLDRPWVSPDRLTAAGLVSGLAGAGAAALGWWWAALVLWLLSRLLDGLDGPLARRASGGSGSHAGGFLDICADFTVYGAFVVGVGVGAARDGGSLLPFLAVLLAYYVNGASFLAFSSIAERAGRPLDDGRSLSFLGGLAEGTETVLVHALWCLLPGQAGVIAWAWAGLVGLSAAGRVVGGHRALRGVGT